MTFIIIRAREHAAPTPLLNATLLAYLDFAQVIITLNSIFLNILVNSCNFAEQVPPITNAVA